jgi:hypothetical protein
MEELLADLDLIVLAKSLIVLGLAFVASGIVFLLPRRRAEPEPETGTKTEAVAAQENIERVEYHLEQMRTRRNE